MDGKGGGDPHPLVLWCVCVCVCVCVCCSLFSVPGCVLVWAWVRSVEWRLGGGCEWARAGAWRTGFVRLSTAWCENGGRGSGLPGFRVCSRVCALWHGSMGSVLGLLHARAGERLVRWRANSSGGRIVFQNQRLQPPEREQRAIGQGEPATNVSGPGFGVEDLDSETSQKMAGVGVGGLVGRGFLSMSGWSCATQDKAGGWPAPAATGCSLPEPREPPPKRAAALQLVPRVPPSSPSCRPRTAGTAVLAQAAWMGPGPCCPEG